MIAQSSVTPVTPGNLRTRWTLSDVSIGEQITASFSGSMGGATLNFTLTTADEIAAASELATAVQDEIDNASGSEAWSFASVDWSSGNAYLEIEYPNNVNYGTLSVESDAEAPTVTEKIWTGNSVARAQVTTLTPLNVLTGDTFSVKINGKAITVTATASTAANVATLLAAGINASTIPEWREVTAVASGDVCTLTARTAGVPFTVTNGSTDAIGLEITTLTAGSSGTNAAQIFDIPLSAAGTFAITFGDQTTTAIAVGASNTTVASALEALSNIGSGDVAVSAATTSDGNDTRYTVTFQGALAKMPVATLIVELTSTKPLIRTTQQGSTTSTIRNEKQTIEFGNAGSFTLTLDGQTTASITSTGHTADDSALIASALNNLSNVSDNGVTVSKLSQDNVSGTATYQIEFKDIDGSAPQSQLTASTYAASGTETHRLTITEVAGVLAVNEVQKVAIQGTASGGTFTLTYSGQTTSSIAYNASTSTVTSALEALSNIGVGDVTVTGSAGAWVIEFTGALAGGDRAQITATSSLTGSSAANVTIATTTSSAGPNHWDTADNWTPSGVPVTGDDVVIDLAAPNILYGLDQTGVTLASLRVSMSWASGRLGLPKYNEGGYLEYRTRELTCGITTITIGDGDGSGPTKIALNTLTTPTTINVIDSGGTSESGVPTVIWRGTHADNVVTVEGGEFGSAWWSDESAQVSTVTQTDGTVFLKNTTIDDELKRTGGTIRAIRCTLGGKPLNI